MRKLLILLLTACAFAQTPTKVRSTTVLPATCNAGTNYASADHIDLVQAGLNTPYYCSATNVWSSVTAGGTGAFLGSNNVFTATNTFKGLSILANLNSIIFVDGVTYTSISSAIAALPANGGMVVLPPHYRETVTSTIDIGSSTQPVTLACQPDTIITNAITNGTSLFNLHNASGFVGVSVGTDGATRYGGCAIIDDPSANYKAQIDTVDGTTSNLGYATVSNIFMTGGGVCQEAFNIQGIANNNVFANIHLDSFKCTQINVSSSTTVVTGPLTLSNIESNCVYVAGCKPLVITTTASGRSNIGITVFGGNYTHAGTTLPEITVDGVGTGAIKGILFQNVYVEDLVNGNNIGYKIRDAQGVSILNGTGEMTTAGDSEVDLSQSSSNLPQNVTVSNLSISSGSNLAKALVNEITSESLGGVNVASYSYGGANTQPYTFTGSQFQINSSTGGNLYLFDTNGVQTNRNRLDAQTNLILDAGLTATQIRNFLFSDRGTSEWQIQADTSNRLVVGDLVNSKTRLIFGQSAAPAASGTLRMPNNDVGVCYRNAGNSNDLCIKYDTTDNLSVSGAVCPAGGTACTYAGAGVPAINCGVGSIFLRNDAASASTVEYVCYPANTWTAVTVP